MLIGYARVSTPEQNIQSQIDLLRQNGCEQIYTDIASGVREDRKGLNDMLTYLREGDTVVVYKTDRIFRSLKNMVDLIEIFNQRKIAFKSLSEPVFDTSSANGKFIIQIFGAVSEFERNLIQERTRIGIEGARRRNKHLGRPRGFQAETLEKYQFALHLYENKNIPIDKACKQANIAKTTFYRIDNSKKKTGDLSTDK
ncbi:recombinase family protein [Capnocytophaga cynodegmi]|uniref:recombinase family protein n=1 Tax=Capnocytophaga cynodegmi TaxID=28189 RepID=UPI000363C080|nr:recombinase family protein [Capnocytophaga cynodegmi]CEN42286.1 Resolvase [Capnocytophaga cynodegmi]